MSDTPFPLASGRFCMLRARPLPLLPTYHVLYYPGGQGCCSERDEHEMFALAHTVARELGRRYHHDPGCYTLLFSGGRTRRRPWPHFHIVAVDGVGAKRRALLLLYVKRVLIRLGRLEERIHGGTCAGSRSLRRCLDGGRSPERCRLRRA